MVHNFTKRTNTNHIFRSIKPWYTGMKMAEFDENICFVGDTSMRRGKDKNS